MSIRTLDQMAMERHIFLETVADSLGRGQYWGTELNEVTKENDETDRDIRAYFAFEQEKDLIDLEEYEAIHTL